MKIYLEGGPANGRTVEVAPGTVNYLQQMPRNWTLKDCVQASIDPTLPSYDVARYRHTFHATVDSHGSVRYVIFEYIGTEPH